MFQVVSRKIEGRGREGVIQGSLKVISKKLKGCFKEFLMVFQLCLKGF